jgi:hypothetical protein
MSENVRKFPENVRILGTFREDDTILLHFQLCVICALSGMFLGQFSCQALSKLCSQEGECSGKVEGWREVNGNAYLCAE